MIAAVTLAALGGCATGELIGGEPDAASDQRDGGRPDVPVQVDAPPFVLDAAEPDAPECEAVTPPEGSSPTCGGGDKGTLGDDGGVVSVTGNLTPDTSEDWYTFVARDSVAGAPSGCDLFHVTVRLVSNPGAGFVFDVFRGACPATHDGGAAAPDAGVVPCLAEPSRYDWYTDLSVVTDGGPMGECPCGDPDAGPVQCTDDTQRFHVRVRRAPGQPASCDPYVLELSNGKYHGAFP